MTAQTKLHVSVSSVKLVNYWTFTHSQIRSILLSHKKNLNLLGLFKVSIVDTNSGFAHPLKNLERSFYTKHPGKPLEFLYYPWKILENKNDAKDSVKCPWKCVLAALCAPWPRCAGIVSPLEKPGKKPLHAPGKPWKNVFLVLY